MARMYPAEPHDFSRLGSRGDANHMLLRQFQFPLDYEDDEGRASRYSDRAMDHDLDQWRSILMQHTGEDGDRHLTDWVRNERNNDAQLMALFADIIGVEKHGWTGYRVTVTIGDNGQDILFFELFAKREGSTTEVYSGENAPNIRPRKRASP